MIHGPKRTKTCFFRCLLLGEVLPADHPSVSVVKTMQFVHERRQNLYIALAIHVTQEAKAWSQQQNEFSSARQSVSISQQKDQRKGDKNGRKRSSVE